MSNGILGIGISGLAAAQAGLVTTGHNIANASAEGYHRQSIRQSTATPLLSGNGYIGQGTRVDSVLRAYSGFIQSQVGEAQAQASYYATYHAQLTAIDNVIADCQAGLSSALQEFFAATQGVAADPSSMPARQLMLAAGETLASRFNLLGARFDEARAGVDSRVRNVVGEINSYAQQIAALNSSILAAQQNPAQPPNDLLDRRDLMISELNKLVGASTVAQSDGSIDVFIGNGQSLVIGKQVMSLTVAPAQADASRLEVGYVSAGLTVPLNQAGLRSGSLGALLAFRDGDLNAAQNALGRVAIAVGQGVNNQHQLGQDLMGMPGAAFFSLPAPAVIASAGNAGNANIMASVADANALTVGEYRVDYDGSQYRVTRLSDNTAGIYAALPQTIDGVTLTLAAGSPAAGDSFLIAPTRNVARGVAMVLQDGARIAAAVPIRSAAAAGNTGSGRISAGTVDAPPPPNVNLQQPVTITFTGANTFNVSGAGTGNPTGVPYTAGASINYNGWTLQLQGNPAAGDVFTVSANSGGVADGRNALALAGLQTSNTLGNGTMAYQGAYGQMVAMVGSRTQQFEIMAQAQGTVVSQAVQAQQSLSGVNLDEEAASLLRYQQAYQASGKLIQISGTLFQTLLDLGR